MAPNGQPVFHGRNICVRYGALVAVDNVSLDVSPGEILGVIGPNGSGKTTLFNAITGYVPFEGTVTFRGQTLPKGFTPVDVARLGITRTFQNGGLFPSLSVLENVMVGFHMRLQAKAGIVVNAPRSLAEERKARQEALAALDYFGIADLADHVTRDLPIGQQKLAELCRAFLAKPTFLLLDEPGVGLSSYDLHLMVEMLQRLARDEGIALLLTDHRIEAVMDVATRLMVLNSGKCIAAGKPDDVIRDEAVVQAYLGSD